MADPGLLQVISYIDTVNKKYPRLAPFLDIPQVGRLILLLAAEKIEPDEFERRLKNTRYWKKTSESMRRWRILKFQDPATANRRVHARLATVRDLASTLGVHFGANDPRLRALAERTLRRDMTEEEMTDMLLSFTSFRDEGRGTTGTGRNTIPRGTLGATILQLRDLAKQNMISPTPRQQFADAQKLLTGGTTIEALAASYAQRSLRRYGSNQTLKDHIAGGGTMADFFDSYREMIGEELEIPADSIDLMQPRWEEIMNTVTAGDSDPNAFGYKGSQAGSAFRPMTLSEARQWVRSRPEWGQSRGAKSKAAALGEALGQRFGAVA